MENLPSTGLSATRPNSKMSVQVRKMPVEIEGETIWVECVPGGAGDRQVGWKKKTYFARLF